MNKKILIVDDEIAVCKYLSELLTAFDYRSGYIINPKLLFPRLDHEPAHLIILDVNMPGINGMEILQQLKQHPKYHTIPVIMLTGEHDEKLVEQCLNLGAADFVNKPVSIPIIRSRIQTVLAARQNTQELERLVDLKTVELKQANVSLADSNTQLEQSKLQLEISYSELERISQTFRLFVPNQFINRILSQQNLQSGFFEEEKMTVLFADIRSYTQHVEHMSPEENFAFLNEFFGLVEPSISRHGGFVDKYIGDAIMALFDQETSATDAVMAAIEMQKSILSLNQHRKQQNLPEINFGIGINTGRVMLGALGSASRLNSTAIGDHVNLASRIEGLTKKFNAKILISQSTYEELPPRQFLIREIDKVRVRGRSASDAIYEVIDGDDSHLIPLKLETRTNMEEGIRLYRKCQFSRAMLCFEQCIQQFPQDVIVLEYLKRCRYFEKYPPVLEQNREWDGIVPDSSKLIDQTVRRRAKRYEIDTHCLIYPYGAETPGRGTVRDISICGIRLELNTPFYNNDILLLEIHFGPHQSHSHTEIRIGENESRYKVLGRLVWIIPLQSEPESWLAGLEFWTVSRQEEEAFEQAILEFKNKEFFKEKQYRIDRQILIFSFDSSMNNRFDDFKRELNRLIQSRNIQKIICSLRAVNHLNSADIGVLVTLYKHLNKTGIRLILCELNHFCLEVVTQSGLASIFTINTDERQALASFSEQNQQDAP
ncbi:MAG: response regulator [SAR324 cluster bacterium]|nr:response regulator [SAR324 cluster bacterium]